MNAQIQSQLDRVEVALNTLIDSITAYNPSPAAAISLVSADDDLTAGLEQLTIHQSNYALLLSLRAQMATLDTRIKTTLSTLASTRMELLTSTPITLLPDSEARTVTHDVDFNDLLSYAARIAKFTVPPTYRPPLPPPIEDDPKQQQLGVSSPTPTGTVLSPAPPAGDAEAVQPIATLTPAQRAWLDSASSSVPFTPWPRDDHIRRGALAQIEAARDRGVVDVEHTDLTEQVGMLTGGDEEARLRQEAEEQEEEQRRVRDEEETRRRRHSISMGDGAAVTQRPRRREEPAREEVFEGFELYNPDDA